MGFGGLLRQVRDSVVSWTPRESEPAMAFRAALGVAGVLVVYLVTDRPDWGPAAILGAWCAGIAYIAPGIRPRPALPLLAAAGIGLALFLGGLAAGSTPATLIVSALWALLMAYLGSLGPAVATVTMVCGVSLVLSGQLTAAAGPGEAAAAAFVGGLAQVGALLLPPWRRHRAERAALADAYRSLAADARALADAMNTPLSTEALLEAQTAIAARHRSPEALREASSHLHELATAITAVAAARARLLATNRTDARRTGRVLRDAATALDIFAEAIRRGRPPGAGWTDRLDRAVDAAPVDGGTVRHAVAAQAARRLHRALHRCAELTARVVAGEPDILTRTRRERALRRARADLQQLRGNLAWRSAALRHAIRAATTIAVSTAIGLYWPGDHGYWLPLAAWIVLRPDFASTIGRGTARGLGTVLGAVAASLVSAAAPPESLRAAVAVAGFALVGYLTMPVSFLVYSAAVSGFAVFQIDLAGEAPLAAAWERGAVTLLGVVLALGLYSLWPTWQTRRLPDLLADLVDAYRRYAAVVLRRQIDPAAHDPGELRAAVDAVRARRAAVSVAAYQAAAEPIGGPRPWSADALALEAALSRAARALIVLNGGVRSDDREPLPELAAFADTVNTAYARLAARIRGQPTPAAPDLAAALDELQPLLSTDGEAVRHRLRLLDWESDILTDALSDAAHITTDWTRAPGPSPR